MVDPEERRTGAEVAAKLDRAEWLLGEGEVGAAVDVLGAAAKLITRAADEPRLLGRAAWLAAPPGDTAAWAAAAGAAAKPWAKRSASSSCESAELLSR